MNTLDLNADIIDVRDIIDRFEELEREIPENDSEVKNWDDLSEFMELQKILKELKGYGGDEQWLGDWYPLTLICDSYFVEYTEDLIADCYDIPKSLDWPYRHMAIDYKSAADELKGDFTFITIGENDYWFR